METEITKQLASSLLPERPKDAHKGRFGHVLVIAGSRGFTGAAKLASEAALRTGAGLVTLAIPSTLANVMASCLVEVMTLPLPATEAESFSRAALQQALNAARDKQATVLGPGLSQHPETREFVHGFVRACTTPCVIDADGLNCLASDPETIRSSSAPLVLTPHPAEMARLNRRTTAEVQASRVATAIEFAREYGCTVVLKGHRSIVADSDSVHVNPTGNSGMATGGTGDVLAGIIGGLLAQGLTPANAAVLGVYAHGLAGDFAAEEFTERAMTAGDLLRALPHAWRSLEKLS